MGLILLAVLFFYLVIGAILTKKVNDSSVNKPKKRRILNRAFFYAIIWGIGPIGVEGFGLPGPLLISILFILVAGTDALGAIYLPLTLVIWCVVFLLFQLLYEKLISSFTPKETKKSDGSEWFQ